MTLRPFIRKVTIRNYKSIAACQLNLSNLVFIVGPNGAGKSNFLDSLRFCSDSLRYSLDHALRDRGTIKEVRRRSGGHPNHFALRFDFELPSGSTGHYSFSVAAKSGGAYEVKDEECHIVIDPFQAQAHHYRINAGKITSSTVSQMPAVVSDRLFLVAASGIPEFRPVFDALSRIEVYNLSPREIAAMQKPDPGDILRRDGSNAASVFERVAPGVKQKIEEKLSRIVSGVVGARTLTLGSQETLEFRQNVKGQKSAWKFPAAAMSDGTLRAFGALLAVFQAASAVSEPSTPLLIGLEEPEIALHPAAASVLLSALREGAQHCQIIVTSHSPDLLDNPDMPPESIVACETYEGLTHIGPIDQPGKDLLRDRLFTAGELLRQNQLRPDKYSIADVHHERQLGLFGNGQ